jgi:hypothetical protein
MLMVPLILLLNEKSALLALAVSGTVWLLAGIYQIAPQNMLFEGDWFLNPFSWQFLFTIGIVSMMHVKRGGTLPRHPLLFALALGYVVLSFIWVTARLWDLGNHLAALGLPAVLTGFDKTFLSLPRLLHVLALSVSGAVWLIAGIYQIAPHNMIIADYWFLNPLSWQFIFTIGIVGMMHVKRGGSLPQHPILFVLASGYVALSFAWVVGHLWDLGNALAALGLPSVLTGFDKTFLSLPRLLHVLALTYLVINIPALSRMLRRPSDHPLTILGRHSLNIFVAGTILAMAGQVLLYVTNRDQFIGPMFVVAGIAAQFAYAYHLERKRLDEKAKPAIGRGAMPVPVRINDGRK